jgi:hypothetical protein
VTTRELTVGLRQIAFVLLRAAGVPVAWDAWTGTFKVSPFWTPRRWLARNVACRLLGHTKWPSYWSPDKDHPGRYRRVCYRCHGQYGDPVHAELH